MVTFRATQALAAAGVVFFTGQFAHAQNDYSLNIVGYVNRQFVAGTNLFGNPLTYASNTLSLLIPNAPVGTSVSLWDSVSLSYSQTSVYTGGGWSLNLSLDPGTGARLVAPSVFTNTFVGSVIFRPGTPPNDMLPATLFDGTPGVHLLSSVTPYSYPGTYDAFTVIVGRAPITGDGFTWLDASTQAYHTTTFNGELGIWDNGEPALAVTAAAYFNVQPVPVPEPSALALVLIGVAAIHQARRKRQVT